jgi:hypothetical protein
MSVFSEILGGFVNTGKRNIEPAIFNPKQFASAVGNQAKGLGQKIAPNGVIPAAKKYGKAAGLGAVNLGYTAAGSITGKAMGVVGLGQMAARNPVKSSLAALGLGLIITNSSPEGQSQVPHPATQVERPGGYGSRGGSDYDLGASGDLVFALHRNR